METEGKSKRVSLITGAQGGLGSFVTQAFLEAGFSVAGLARSIHTGGSSHPDFVGMSVDLINSGATRAAVGSIMDRFGRIDVMVHLIGGFEGGKTVPDTDDAAFEWMLDLNLRSALNIVRVVVPNMRHARYGRIVAVGSRAAVEAQALVGAYAASKAALVSLVRTLALENNDAGITANVVLPGTIDTPANRIAMPGADPSKWVDPARLAKLILWLSSDDAAQISGAQIPVHGLGE